MTTLLQQLQQKTGMEAAVINNIIQLLDEGNTIPFIARYRKEMTKGATDEQLRDFFELYSYRKNLEARKEDVIRLIAERGLLTESLKNQILAAETLARVEDLYRPFKEKKNTKATQEKISKSLENPILEAVKKDDLNLVMKNSAQKKVIPPNQISVALDKFENKIIEEHREH